MEDMPMITFLSPEGKYERRYMSGTIKDKRFYQNGHISGKYMFWHPDGYLYISEFFRNGLLNGESKMYENEHNIMRRFYKDGLAVDGNFSWKKKQIFLNLKKYLYRHIIPDYNSFLICDLKGVI